MNLPFTKPWNKIHVKTIAGNKERFPRSVKLSIDLLQARLLS